MACYNAITGLDPGYCLFKKQWEWEEAVRFHTPGWETWAGPQSADWRPIKSSPQLRRSTSARRRPIRLELSPPIEANQPIAASQGRERQQLLWIQRGTTERSPRGGKKKGKVIQERKKLMVVVQARRGGGLYFSIDQIVEVSWPQSAPDGPTDGLLWDGLSIWKLDLFDRGRSHGLHGELRWGDWWFRTRPRTSRTYRLHPQLCCRHL